VWAYLHESITYKVDIGEAFTTIILTESNYMNKLILTSLAILLTACAAKPVLPGAEKVMLSNEKPASECEFVAEVSGGQGNWWTDDITSSENVAKGSRNDLRNEAFKIGATYVYIQQTSGSQTYLGGSTMAIIGNAYKCL
jgi:hypothetical protein